MSMQVDRYARIFMECGLQSNLDFQSNQIKSEGFQFCKSCFISKCFGFTLEIRQHLHDFTFFCASMHTHVMIDSKATLDMNPSTPGIIPNAWFFRWNPETERGLQAHSLLVFWNSLKKWQEKMPTDAKGPHYQDAVAAPLRRMLAFLLASLRCLCVPMACQVATPTSTVEVQACLSTLSLVNVSAESLVNVCFVL